MPPVAPLRFLDIRPGDLAVVRSGPFVVATGKLDPTATYDRRSWAWVSNSASEVVMKDGEVIPGLGMVTIRVQHRDRHYVYADKKLPKDDREPRTQVPKKYENGDPPPGVEIDTYVLAAAEPQFPGCRAFLLENVTDPHPDGPYTVHVGGVTKCRCMAGDCKVVTGCKHVHTLTAMVSAGLLDFDPPAPDEQIGGADEDEFDVPFVVEWIRKPTRDELDPPGVDAERRGQWSDPEPEPEPVTVANWRDEIPF